jgi:surface protein
VGCAAEAVFCLLPSVWLFFDLLKGYTSKEGSGTSLECYTQLTNSNIKTAAQLWVSNQASATSTYGLVPKWDLSQVTSLENVWCGGDAVCGGQSYMAMRSFNDQLQMWDVSKVTTMKQTFYYASAFNGDLSQWDVAKVISMSWTFFGNWKFNSNLDQWDVAKVTDMFYSKSKRIL